MRIAVWHGLPSGGGKRALFDHVYGLLERGHEVVAWCPPEADESFLPLASLTTVRIGPAITPPSRYRGATFLRQVLYDCDVRLQLLDEHCKVVAREIDAGQFDVVFANAVTYAHAPPLGRYVNIPALLYLGEPARRLYEAFDLPPFSAQSRRQVVPTTPGAWIEGMRWIYQTRQKALRIGVEVGNAASYDILAVNSIFSRETVLRAYGLDARVCYLGVDTKVFRPSSINRERIAVTVGSAQGRKNVDFVIRALSNIAPARRPRLIWVTNTGDDFGITKVLTQARALQVGVEVLVGISDEELVTVLNRSCVMAYAPRLEPFGLAALEAAACELPVVAVAEGGVRETVLHGETGILTSASEEEFATNILKLLDTPTLARQFGTAGRRRVDTFWTRQHAAARLETLLSSVVEGCGY